MLSHYCRGKKKYFGCLFSSFSIFHWMSTFSKSFLRLNIWYNFCETFLCLDAFVNLMCEKCLKFCIFIIENTNVSLCIWMSARTDLCVCNCEWTLVFCLLKYLTFNETMVTMEKHLHTTIQARKNRDHTRLAASFVFQCA